MECCGVFDWLSAAFRRVRDDAPSLAILVDAYLSAAQADARIGVIDAAELSGGNALDGLFAVDVEAFLIEGKGAVHEMVHVTHLELDVHHAALRQRLLPGVAGDEVKVGETEVVAVLQLSVPAVRHEDDVVLDVLFHHEPGSAAES